MLPARLILALAAAVVAVNAETFSSASLEVTPGLVSADVREAEETSLPPASEQPINGTTLTEAPITPTEVPITPTEAPISTTEAPISTTEAPVTPTEAPVTPTEAPVTPTEAPVIPTETPVIPTEAPVIPTEAPVIPTEAPVTPTEAPVTPTEAPISGAPGTETGDDGSTTAPTSGPVNATETPEPTAVNATISPETSAPVNSTDTPEPTRLDLITESPAPVTTAPPLPCETLKNKDRVGSDLSNVRGAFEDCAAKCKDTERCVTFSWSNHEGGTCWLKSSASTIVDKADVWTTSCTFRSETCDVIKDKDRAGHDLSNVRGAFEECEAKCRATDKCVAFSWSNYEGGTCWLKSSASKLVDAPGVWTTSCTYRPEQEPPTPQVYNGIDFIGNDFANHAGKTADECWAHCSANSRCKAFTWSNYLGGTCWLKTGVMTTVAKSGVASGLVSTDGTQVCALSEEVDFQGQDIGNKPAADAGVCCGLCQANKDCKAYTWSNYKSGTCWMKSGKGKAVPTKGMVSAELKTM